MPLLKAGKKKWESEAERKRITRQRNKLIEEIAELKGESDMDMAVVLKQAKLQRELENLEHQYFSYDRPSKLKYADYYGAQHAANSSTRKAMWKLRQGKKLSVAEMGIIKVLRYSLSRRSFAKLKENRKK